MITCEFCWVTWAWQTPRNHPWYIRRFHPFTIRHANRLSIFPLLTNIIIVSLTSICFLIIDFISLVIICSLILTNICLILQNYRFRFFCYSFNFLINSLINNHLFRLDFSWFMFLVSYHQSILYFICCWLGLYFIRKISIVKINRHFMFIVF